MKSTSDLGNFAFMVTICAFAFIGATTTAVLGFTSVALGVVFACTFFGTFVAVFVENKVNKYTAKQREREMEQYMKDGE